MTGLANMDQDSSNLSTPAVSKPITSAKSASDLADLLLPPPESKEGDLLRNKGSDIDLNALYQQSHQQQQSGYGIGMMMPMMNAGRSGMQPVPGYNNVPSPNNMAGNKMFHIGSPQNMANTMSNTMGVGGGIFNPPNVTPTRTAPRPPQFNTQPSASNPITFNNMQQPNVNQMSSGMFQQTMAHRQQQPEMQASNPFQMTGISGSISPQNPFQNQAAFPPGPSIMPNVNQTIASSLAASSTPNLSLSSGFTTVDLPMVDPAVTIPGQDPFSPKGNTNFNNPAAANQLAIGGGLNINFPKSMSTSSLRTNLSMTEPGSIDLSLTPGSGDFVLLEASPPPNNVALTPVQTTEENTSKKKFGAFQFLQRNSEVV